MSEDDGDSTSKADLGEEDIRTNVYEGGYKSWECSFDLAKLLLDRGPRKDLDDLCRVDHVVEVCFDNDTLSGNLELTIPSSAVALQYLLWYFSTTPSAKNFPSTSHSQIITLPSYD